MNVLKFIIPLRLPSAANLRDAHWGERRRRVQMQRKAFDMGYRNAVANAGQWVPAKEWPLLVTMTRVAPYPLDRDNLGAACKSLRDQAADCLGLPNDRVPWVEWRYQQARPESGASAHQRYAVRVRIEHREPTCAECGNPLECVPGTNNPPWRCADPGCITNPKSKRKPGKPKAPKPRVIGKAKAVPSIEKNRGKQ